MIDDKDYRCVACGRLCDVVAQVSIDREPYGDQFVERRTYEYYSLCCGDDVELIDINTTVH